jgi:hypothetical protein
MIRQSVTNCIFHFTTSAFSWEGASDRLYELHVQKVMSRKARIQVVLAMRRSDQLYFSHTHALLPALPLAAVGG